MTTLAIVGARFRPPAKEILDNLSSGTKLLLRRQPDNPYDANAVQVLLPINKDYGDTIKSIIVAYELVQMEQVLDENGNLPEPLHLGFIPRGDAIEISIWMDGQEKGHGYGDTQPCEWPCTLTFLPSGQPAVSFEKPT